MAKMVEKRRVHCSIRHVDAFIVKVDDKSYSVKCSFLQACGDSCPYLKDPEYRSSYRRAPEYKPK